jgi:hypothetical protein
MPTKTNSVTTACITYLNLNGFCVWRNNNGAVYSKARGCYLKNPTHKQGVPDIIGYHKKTGKAFYCEIKTGKDKLSVEQYNFLETAKEAGCVALCVHTIDELIINLIESSVNKI